MRIVAIVAAVLLTTVGMVRFAVSQPPGPPLRDRADAGLPSLLRTGMEVSLQTNGDSFSVIVNPLRNENARIFTVGRVGRDFVLLQDRARTAQRWIPIYAIRDVEVRRTGVQSDPNAREFDGFDPADEPDRPRLEPRPFEPPKPFEPRRPGGERVD